MRSYFTGVAEVLGAANELEENRIKERIPIDQLVDKVTSYFGIKLDDILLIGPRSLNRQL